MQDCCYDLTNAQWELEELLLFEDLEYREWLDTKKKVTLEQQMESYDEE